MSAKSLFEEKYPQLVELYSKLNQNRAVETVSQKFSSPVIDAGEFGKIRLAGIRNPLKAALLDIKKFNYKAKTLVVMGVGSGYHLKVLLDEFAFEKIIVVPLSSELLEWFLEYSLYAEEIVASDKVIFEDMDFINRLNEAGHVNIYIEPKAASCAPFSNLRTSLLGLRQQAEALLREGTLLEDNEVENLANSARYNNVAELFGKESGKQAIVVGGGPSLKTFLPYLKKLKSNTILIACSTAAKVLISNEINIDYLAYIEATDLPEKHLKGLEPLTMPLVLYVHSNPHVAVGHAGPVYLARNEAAGIYDDYGTLFSKGNVSHMVTALAIRLGVKSVGFLGFDLGFESEDFYCDGVTVQHSIGGMKADIEVPNVKGDGMARTSLIYHTVRKNLEELILRFTDSMEFFNLGQSGVQIEGSRHLSEEEAITYFFEG